MIDQNLSLILDLLGTFVFALSGGVLAIRRDLDIFGVLVLAIAAGLAGGLTRDALIGAHPPAALADPRLLLAALGAGFLTFFGHRVIDRLDKPVMVLDAAGLGFFAASGCQKGLDFGYGPLPAMILGVLTAVGGGVLRDLLVTEVPRVLREDVYALAALIGAGIVVAGEALHLSHLGVTATAVLLTIAVRIVSVWRGWRAPRAPGRDR